MEKARSGTNASPDTLDGGTLQLYGEDASGLRTLLAAVDPDLTVSAEPGADVRSARFTAIADAETFVAVYRGKLGNEVSSGDPADGGVDPSTSAGSRPVEADDGRDSWMNAAGLP